jgi:TonB family protein
METAIHYLIWTSIYILLLGVTYFLMIRPLKLPSLSRVYLIAGLLICLVPGYAGPLLLKSFTSETIVLITIPEIIAGTSSQFDAAQSGITGFLKTQNIIWIIISTISFFLFLRVIISIGFLISKIIRSQTTKIQGLNVVCLNEDHAPFSFFNYVFIPCSLTYKPSLDKIILHEKGHYLKGHSLDLIFIEIFTIFFWFHPLVWYLRKEMKLIHEFEADQFVIRNKTDKPSYQELLLNMSFTGRHIPITNPFNFSPLKLRIMMMNTKNTNPALKIVKGLLMALPLFALLTFFHACMEIDQKPAPAEEVAIEEKNADDVIFTVVETAPEFKGGTTALISFLQEKLVYPETAKEAKTAGTVYVSFVVDTDGSITDTKILRGVSQELDEEALRVVNLMPNWNPGTQRGQAVKVQFNMPIRFVLD